MKFVKLRYGANIVFYSTRYDHLSGKTYKMSDNLTAVRKCHRTDYKSWKNPVRKTVYC